MELEEVGRLCLAGGGHVTAASGLVRHDGRLWVVSDDSFALSVFPEDLSGLGEQLPLSDEPLPDDPAARKGAKPDLESLALLPDGTLLALGSGSTDRRDRGFRVHGDAVEVVDLSGLYGRLRRELEDLNIEGCAHRAGRLWLAQRGNGEHGFDALVECTLELELLAIHPIELPDGLNFSDLAPLPGDRLAFGAVHEAGGCTYQDGEVTAAALGVIEEREVVELHRLPAVHKIEGVLPERDGGFLLVADPDDAEQAAPLLRARP